MEVLAPHSTAKHTTTMAATDRQMEEDGFKWSAFGPCKICSRCAGLAKLRCKSACVGCLQLKLSFCGGFDVKNLRARQCSHRAVGSPHEVLRAGRTIREDQHDDHGRANPLTRPILLKL